MFEAMVYILRVGCPWRDLPAISRPTAVCRHQPHQGASGCKQSRWWPTKSGDWAYQGRPEYQAQCLGGQPRAARQFELGPETSGRCKHSARRARRCGERRLLPTRATTATSSGRNCGDGEARLVFHPVATGSSPPVGTAAITASGTRSRTYSND
jgi:hypothetical protein